MKNYHITLQKKTIIHIENVGENINKPINNYNISIAARNCISLADIKIIKTINDINKKNWTHKHNCGSFLKIYFRITHWNINVHPVKHEV